MKTIILGTLTAVFLSGSIIAADNPQPANASAQGGGAYVAGTVPEGTDLSFCFDNGQSGAAKTRICLSRTGNLTSFESPQGREHIRQGTILEGYAVCSNGGATVHGWDAAFSASAWGATIVAPGPTITRTTADGVFRIVQTYAFNGPEGELKITMKVTNLSFVTRSAVVLSRFFDGDVDGTFNEFGSITSASVFEWLPKPGHGLKLTSLTFKTAHDPYVETFGSLNYSGCIPSSPLSMAGPDDLAGRVNYRLGNINPGASKTVVFGYERI